MSLDLKPVQVRLPPEVYDALKMISDANDHDLGEEAREILTEALMGKGHTLMMALRRLQRAVGSDNMRQGASTNGKPSCAADALRQKAEKEYE